MASNETSPPRKIKPARIVVVDDHPMVRERLAEAVEREGDLTVCGQAESRHEALTVIRKIQPDLVIVDLTLKASSGLELIKDIRVRWPKLLMLVVSMHDESLYAERVIRAGARGYITKQQATRDILKAIRTVLAGDLYLHPNTATQIVARLTANPAAPSGQPVDLLTDREMQVFELTGHGFSTRQIAEQLHIDVKTVETYRARIKEKLKLKDFNELLQLAIRWNQNR
jgi:DNA-binding NarL/FixJ family response regulator